MWNLLVLLLKDTSSLATFYSSQYAPSAHIRKCTSNRTIDFNNNNLRYFNTLTLESSASEQLLKVGLEPSTSLRSRGQRVGVTTVGVVTAGARVTGAVALSARLDPDEGVDKRVASVGGRGASETGTLDVAPVAPGLLRGRLDAAAALVDDEVGVPAVRLEQRGDGVDVQLLIVVLVALGVGRGDGGVVAVVVGDVSGQAAERGWLAGSGVDLGEHLGGGGQVGFPA